MNDHVKILGINVATQSRDLILEKIEKDLKSGKKTGQKPLIIYTPNPEIVMYAQKDQKFREIVNKGQINIPDGAGIVWAANTLGCPIRERISGADLVEKIVYLAEKESAVIGLIGGFDKVALKALECLQQRYPRLKGWFDSKPELRIKNHELRIINSNWNISKFINNIKEKNTRVLFVGLGCPKQEYFINEIADKLDNIIIMAVGGTFDYLSGRIPRAPKWVQNLGFEWLYRLIREPWRIKRQLQLPVFVFKILKSKLIH